MVEPEPPKGREADFAAYVLFQDWSKTTPNYSPISCLPVE